MLSQAHPTAGLSQTIRRRVLKFQLPAHEAPALATHIGGYVPAFRYGDGPLATRVTSLYLDSDGLELYRQSSRAPDQAGLIRLRWYSWPAGSPVFLELKHRSAETGLGVKQRYVLPAGTAAGFRGTEAELESVALQVRSQAGPAIEEFLDQCHAPLRVAALRPKLYVRYRRQSFQEGAAADVRVTLDSHVIMAVADDWASRAERRAHRFPAAILEIKLEGGSPPWLNDLLAKARLQPLAGFSKWTYGVRELLG